MTALVLTRMSGRAVARQLAYQGQAHNAAAAGLTEALSWFVHQRKQPVTAFDPKLDPNGVCPHTPKHVPTVNESDDPAIGIVRDYEIMASGRVRGRYEVRRSAVADVSTRRGKTQAGTIWSIESLGIVYVRNNTTDAPGTGNNTILARRTMRTEIQRLGIQLPANAALNVSQGRNVNIQKQGRVQGGSSGIGLAFPSSTGTPTIKGTVTGSPPQNPSTNPFPLKDVFAVSQQELIAMADLVVADERDLPDPLPNMALIVITGSAQFNGQRKLNGSGILVVLGNLNLNAQSDPFFNGLIWVGGNLIVNPPANINGSVIVNGNVQLTGGNEVSEIDYDPTILDQIRQQKGNYLASRSPWVVGGGS
ncbi:MAG TPA: hypothetical protein VMU84_16770 [Thermoanaerobaculia bacterium]|nr:hypothetical protein [Thermoanaerobaculia bacterium]